MNRKIQFMIFSIGACGYGLIEVLWRGYTHWSMLWAGGVSFLGLSSISHRMRRFRLWVKAAVGGGLITTVEFCFGVVFNIVLKKNVWDYSRMPLNLGGQICAGYSLLWTLLCLIAVPFAGGVRRRLMQKN